MNTTQQARNTRNRQTGSSLILALILVVVAATAAAIVYSYSANQATMGKKAIDLLKARSIAEAGINLAYNQLRSDVTLANNPNVWPWTDFDGGQYTVTPYVVASNRITLVSVGKFNSVQAQVRVDLHYYPSVQVQTGGGGSSGGTIYGPYVFTNALYVGGTINWGGCGTFCGGSVYANGEIALGGNATWTKGTGTLTVASSTKVSTQGSADLTADVVTAPVIYEKKSGGIVGAKVVAAVPAPSLPSIELSPFYQVASQNHQVVTNASYSVSTSPPGGVLWCEGSLDFKADVTGCFIATAGATMESQAIIRPYNGAWPTLYVKSGGASFAGQGTIYGFTWIGGNLKFTGGGTIYNGPVIVTGLLDKGGNSDMQWFIPSSGYVISPPVVNPQQYSNTLQRLVITGWQ